MLALAVCGLFALASTSLAQTSTPPPAPTPTPISSTVINVGGGFAVELVHRVDYGQVFITAALLLILGALVVFFVYATIEKAFER
jgi:hypothetical protein